MKGVNFIQTLGVIIAVPLMVFAVHENYWAEPEPPKITPTVTVETEAAGYSELIQEWEVETLEKNLDDIDLIAACVESEAGNQSILGKRLVVDVILNRVESPDFPDTIEEVIYQAKQFQVVDNGQIDKVSPTAESYEAVALEYLNRISYDVLYFQTGYYSNYGVPFEVVGKHYFSTGGI